MLIKGAPGDAILLPWFGSTLAEVMPCCDISRSLTSLVDESTQWCCYFEPLKSIFFSKKILYFDLYSTKICSMSPNYSTLALAHLMAGCQTDNKQATGFPGEENSRTFPGLSHHFPGPFWRLSSNDVFNFFIREYIYQSCFPQLTRSIKCMNHVRLYSLSIARNQLLRHIYSTNEIKCTTIYFWLKHLWMTN